MIVTIDGPSASGKSTVARELAEELGFYYLPTGWLYRAVAYLLVEELGYTQEMLANPKKEDVQYCLDVSRLIYTYNKKQGGALFFDKKDITAYLKDYQVDVYVAIVSPIVMVRELVVNTQRSFAQSTDCIIEGRDSGSVVFPEAQYKFYLTASVEVRAQRWQKDQEQRGNSFTLEQAQGQISSRDKKDKEREHSPLTIPKGAIVIDNSDLTFDQTIQIMLKNIKQ